MLEEGGLVYNMVERVNRAVCITTLTLGVPIAILWSINGFGVIMHHLLCTIFIRRKRSSGPLY